MQPRYLLDFDIDKPAASRSIWTATRLVRQLHWVFSDLPGVYALALPPPPAPPFSGLRVFATTSEELEELQLHLEDPVAPAIKIREVPADFSGKWLCYARYRVPSRKQERHADGRLRERRILEAEQERLPYFSLRSGSNKHYFRLYVKITEGEAQVSECEPNSYGLASEQRLFTVPNVPFHDG